MDIIKKVELFSNSNQKKYFLYSKQQPQIEIALKLNDYFPNAGSIKTKTIFGVVP